MASQALQGQGRKGHIVEDGSLVEGADVYVVPPEAKRSVDLPPDELAELEAGIAEADRGETITEDELFRRLRPTGPS